MYECLRCGYKTNLKTNMSRHYKRKRPCVVTMLNVECSVLLEELERKNIDNYDEKSSPIIVKKSKNFTENSNNDTSKYSCSFCNKTFKHRQSKYNHERRFCKMAKTQMSETYSDNMSSKNIHTPTHTTNTVIYNNNTTNNIINNNIINNNIHIHSVGSEDIQHLVPFIKKHIKDFRKREPRFFYDYMKEKHFNVEYPENRNVLCTNKKMNKVQMWSNDNKCFETRNKKDATLILYKVIVDDVKRIIRDLYGLKRHQLYYPILQKTIPYIQDVISEYEYNNNSKEFSNSIAKLKTSLQEIYIAVYDGTINNT